MDLVTRRKMKKLIALLLFALPVFAQQPQTHVAPIYSVNAKYLQGVGVGYWPQAGAGLVLNIAAGRVRCGNTMANYAGGTLTMANNTTNYVYLDATSSCVPSTNTTGYISTMAGIATVVTASGVITTITDDRTMGFEFKNGATALGTVTSVAQTVPSWLAISGSPVTTTGTLAITPATGQTSHQVIGTCNAATTFTPCTLVEGDLPAATVFTDQNATFGAHTYDFSGVTLIKSRKGAGLTTSADGDCGYDTTNKNWHCWVNGADLFMVPLAAGFVSGHCPQPTTSSGSWSLVDSGAACGTSGITGSGTTGKISVFTSSTAIGDIGTPTLCSTGNAPVGIDANGNATGCASIGGTSTYPTATFDNDGTGTTLNHIAAMTAQSTNAIVAVHNASTSTSMNLVGVTVSGAGTTGRVTVQTGGPVSCVFDGATTKDHAVIASTTTAGDCHDAGVFTDDQTNTSQIVGKVQTTNGGAGTYTVDLGVVMSTVTNTAGTTAFNAVPAHLAAYYSSGMMGVTGICFWHPATTYGALSLGNGCTPGTPSLPNGTTGLLNIGPNSSHPALQLINIGNGEAWEMTNNTGTVFNRATTNGSIIFQTSQPASNVYPGFFWSVNPNAGLNFNLLTTFLVGGTTNADWTTPVATTDRWGAVGLGMEAGIGGDATISPIGKMSLKIDNTSGTVAQNDYLINSIITNGQAHGVGPNWPFVGQVIGKADKSVSAPSGAVEDAWGMMGAEVRAGAFGAGKDNSTQTGNLTAVTLQGATFPDGVSQMFRYTVYVVCTASVATSTVQVNLSFTDEVQAQTPNSVGDPGGPGSLSCATSGTAIHWEYNFYGATGTAITYSTTTANSPQYKIRARLESLTN
jgi:hypothetical protein